MQWDIPERVERPRQERQVPSFPDTRGLPSAGCRTKASARTALPSASRLCGLAAPKAPCSAPLQEPTWIEKKGKTDAAFKAQAGNNIFEPEQASPKRPHSAYKQRDFDGHNIFSMDHVGKESPGSFSASETTAPARPAPCHPVSGARASSAPASARPPYAADASRPDPSAAVRPRGIPGVSPEKLALYSGAEARGVMLHTDGSPVRGISDAKKRDIAGSGLFQAQGPQDLFQVRERPVSEAKMKDFVGSGECDGGGTRAPSPSLRIQARPRPRGRGQFDVRGTHPPDSVQLGGDGCT